MTTHRPISHWLMLASLVAMWGSSFVFIKIAVAVFSPQSLVATRLALATLLLGAVMLLTGRRFPSEGRQWRYFAVMAIVGNAMPFWLISWGQQEIDSGLAGILMAVMPLTTLLLAHFFVEGERLNLRRLLGFMLGFVGIVVLTGPDALLELEGRGTKFLPELAVLSGAVCYAVNTIVTRRRPRCDLVVASMGVMLIGSGIMIPLTLMTSSFPLPIEISPVVAVSAAFLGLVSTAMANLVFFRLIATAGPSFMSLTNYLTPLWAVALGFVALGEVPTRPALAALVLILSGIALSERWSGGQGTSPDPPPAP